MTYCQPLLFWVLEPYDWLWVPLWGQYYYLKTYCYPSPSQLVGASPWCLIGMLALLSERDDPFHSYIRTVHHSWIPCYIEWKFPKGRQVPKPILKKKKAVNLLSEHFIVDHLIPPSHSLKAQSVLDCLIVGTAGLMDSLQPELMRSDQMIGWGEALTTFNISPLLLPFSLLLPFKGTPIYQPEYLDLVALDH